MTRVDRAGRTTRVARSVLGQMFAMAVRLLQGGTRRTPDLHDVVLLLMGTGMRIGEALARRERWAEGRRQTPVWRRSE